MGLVHHKAVDLVRRETAHQRRQVAETARRVVEEPARALDQAVAAWDSVRAAEVRAALVELSPAQREAIRPA